MAVLFVLAIGIVSFISYVMRFQQDKTVVTARAFVYDVSVNALGNLLVFGCLVLNKNFRNACFGWPC